VIEEFEEFEEFEDWELRGASNLETSNR